MKLLRLGLWNIWESSLRLYGSNFTPPPLPSLSLHHNSAPPLKQSQSPWEELMDSHFDMLIFLVFGSLACMQMLLMLKEQLFLLGCPPLDRPFTIYGTSTCVCLCRAGESPVDFSNAWTHSLDEVQKSFLKVIMDFFFFYIFDWLISVFHFLIVLNKILLQNIFGTSSAAANLWIIPPIVPRF